MSEDTVEIDFSEFQNREPLKINHRKSYYGRVEEYDVDGNFIRTWNSSGDAAEHHNTISNIIDSCCRNQAGIIQKLGRIFIREGFDIEKRLENIEASKRKGFKPRIKEVFEFNSKGKLVTTWPSITMVAEHYKVHNSYIAGCCNGDPLISKYNTIFLFDKSQIKSRLEAIELNEIAKSMDKSIDEYSKKGILRNHWKSVADISDKYGYPANKIILCCLGRINYFKSSIFLFSGKSIKERLKLINLKKK